MPRIHCSSVDNITWAEGPYPPLAEKSMHIYRLQLSANAIHVPKAKTLLSKDELERSVKYFHERDRNRFILARAALRLILSLYINIPAVDITFTIGENKKPFLPQARNVQFNISHAGDWAITGIAHTSLGVDVEIINPEYDYPSVLDMCLSKAETDHIKSSPNPLETFYRLWTRKEALVKATAKGMDEDFKFIPSMDGIHTATKEQTGSADDWRIITIPLADQHIASIACSPSIEKNSFFEAAELFKLL